MMIEPDGEWSPPKLTSGGSNNSNNPPESKAAEEKNHAMAKQNHKAKTRMSCYEGFAALSEAFASRRMACSHAAQRVISADWFDQAVVALILVNCVFLALDDPTVEASGISVPMRSRTSILVATIIVNIADRFSTASVSIGAVTATRAVVSSERTWSERLSLDE